MNPIWDLITSFVKPVTDLIGKAIPDADKKIEATTAIAQLQFGVAQKMMEYESALLEAQSKAINAEATGQSWLQRNWRPITMITFLVLVVCDSFGLLKFRLADQAWTLLQIGLGGYVVGRSAEKMVPSIVNALAAGKSDK